jgi:hypothetical protein
MALFYRSDSRANLNSEQARSGNERTVPLLLRFVRGARGRRQLQHGRVLTFAQPGELYDLTVRELQRVVMHVGLLQVDLLESRYLVTDQFLASEDLKNMLAFDFRLECDLRAGNKTHCYGWLFDRCEPTSQRVFEPRRHQLVSDLCGS